MPAEFAAIVIEELAEELLQAFLFARQQLTDELAGLVADPARYRREARVRELLGQIDRAVDGLEDEARAWADRRTPHAYRVGARAMADDLGVDWSGFTQADVDAITSLVADTMDDVLARTTYMRETAKRAVREVARTIAPGLVEGLTARQIGDQLADSLRSSGVTTVLYANGAAHDVTEYGRMLARTKTATAINTGGFVQARAWGVEWLETFDGPACGWASHYDLEPAHGRIVTVSEAADFPIAHPNCARSFGPRPDLRGTDGQRARPTGDDLDLARDATRRAPSKFATEQVDATFAAARRGARHSAHGYHPSDLPGGSLEEGGGIYERAGDALLRLNGTDGAVTDTDTWALIRPSEEHDAIEWLYDPDNPGDPSGFEGFLLEVLDERPDLDALGEIATFGDPATVVRLQPGTRVFEINGRRFTSGRFSIPEPGQYVDLPDPLGRRMPPRAYLIDADHDGVWWPSPRPTQPGFGRLPARLDAPDLDDALDRAAAARFNPWTADDLAVQRRIELEREIAARRRARPRRSTMSQRGREPDFADVVGIDELDLNIAIPPWARGTAVEDAARLFDGDGGFLPFLQRQPQPGGVGMYRRSNRRGSPIERRGSFDEFLPIDEATLRRWVNDDGTLTALGERHLDSLIGAGQVIDDEARRRAAEFLASADLPDLDELRQAQVAARRALDDFRDIPLFEHRARWAEEHYGIDHDRALRLQETSRRGLASTLSDADRDDLLRLTSGYLSDGGADATQAVADALRLDHSNASRAVRAREEAEAVAQRDALLDVLGELRARGGVDLRYSNNVRSGRPLAVRQAVDEAADFYPTEWLELSNARGQIRTGEIARGHHSYDSLTGDSDVMLSRGSARGWTVNPEMRSVALHELGHRMEQVIPGLRPAEWAFHTRRTTLPDGSRTPIQQLGRGYGSRERYRSDGWGDNYQGKVYEGGYNGSWEVFTMGIEGVMTGSYPLDREYRAFIIGTLGLL